VAVGGTIVPIDGGQQHFTGAAVVVLLDRGEGEGVEAVAAGQ